MYLTKETFDQVWNFPDNKVLLFLLYKDESQCEAIKTALSTAVSDSSEFVTLVLCDLKDEECRDMACQLGMDDELEVDLYDDLEDQDIVPTLVVEYQQQIIATLKDNEILERLQEPLMPSEAELLMCDAIQAEVAGNLAEAVTKAEKAYNLDPGFKNRMIYSRILIKAKNFGKAKDLLDNLSDKKRAKPEYQDLILKMAGYMSRG